MVITELLSPMRFIRTFTGIASTLKPGWRTKQLENCQTDEVGRHHKVEENRSVQGVDKASHTARLSCLVPSPDRNSDDSIGFFLLPGLLYSSISIPCDFLARKRLPVEPKKWL
uniref:Uncharacterized protein n=1 Tax=Beta vulgaris subsp. maritima TaxID=350892 RepID=F4MLC5_BETVM|nr:hypothetical protein [Beta vulgaris subsp. maritima]